MNFFTRQHLFQITRKIINPTAYLPYAVIICLLFTGIRQAMPQEANPDTLERLQYYFEGARGSDQHLIHGIRYYNLYPAAPGHPFMEPDEFRTGSVIINAREYKAVKLKYDICDQQVLMRYPQHIGGYGEIVLIHDFIRAFEIGERVFRIHTLPKRGSQFCQEIGTGSLKCLYFRHKELIPLNNSLESYNQYTQENKESYLLSGGQVMPFKGKKSFLRLFPESLQHIIRVYMKENRISLPHLTEAGMNDLIKFCETLMEGGTREIRDKS